MGYSIDFIPGVDVALPILGSRARASAFNQGALIEHDRFTLVFNQERGFATYAANNIDGASLIKEGEIPRNDRFRIDPLVPSQFQINNNRGYVNNPWDRGHLARRRSFHWGDRDDAEKADAETFFWTNIAPQHEDLHDTAWGNIEDWMLELADRSDQRACVFTGPVFSEDDPEVQNQPDQTPIKIPAGFWKVIAIKHRQALKTAGFLVWQRDFDKEVPVAFDPFLEQVRLTTIEYLAGLSFAAIRDTDPLHFGGEVDRTGGAALILGRGRRKSTVVASRRDILL